MAAHLVAIPNLPPLPLLIRMHPKVRRDLALLGESNRVHG
jgi:hypothetical protein